MVFVLGRDSVTVKPSNVVPVLPSATLGSLMETSGGFKAAVQVVSREPEQPQAFGSGGAVSWSKPPAVCDEGFNVPLVTKFPAAQNAPAAEKALSLSIG